MLGSMVGATLLTWFGGPVLYGPQADAVLSGGESGMTSLLFERRADGWKIVADHSS